VKIIIINIQRVGVFLLFLIFITFNINGQVEKYSRVKIHFDNGKTIQQLAALGIEVDHGQHKLGHFFVSEFSSTEIALTIVPLNKDIFTRRNQILLIDKENSNITVVPDSFRTERQQTSSAFPSNR
jgi:hypothetical protein